jgi:hypothetical protein
MISTPEIPGRILQENVVLQIPEIGFFKCVTPALRYNGNDFKILEKRTDVYKKQKN